ncbi:MAG TPA: DNA adenine methylase [Sphingobacteriaceae bacterium]|nr:DNA adenine methylase [Sphingobacteriaceae bacterium]
MPQIDIEPKTIKPFLRWAGGKSWLTKHLCIVKDLNFNNYHEGFLGGAATFFYINPKKESFLSDLNPNLIQTYTAIRDAPLEVIEILKGYSNTEDNYYAIRAECSDDPIIKAAQFIYLNQTSYNGIYRVNLKGEYNVPYGFRTKPFLDADAILLASHNLQNTNLLCSDFELIKENLKPKDLVFLDPPYTVSHNHNGFIKYNEKLFSLDDQYRLQKLIDFIKSKGAFYILTNAAHDKVKEIFASDDFLYEFSRANLIGGSNAERGQTEEYIFSNIKLI